MSIRTCVGWVALAGAIFGTASIGAELSGVAATGPAVSSAPARGPAATQPAKPTILRFKENPILRPEMIADHDRGMIDGPSLVRMPDWVPKPLGKYYLYFAAHTGTYIRLAYADDLHGPWKVHEGGVLRIEDTRCRGHIASPDVLVDDQRKEIRMYFHGPTAGKAGQVSLAALSKDGLHFQAQRQVLGPSYFRVWQYGGYYYALSRAGTLQRSKDGLSEFEMAQDVLAREGEASPRHVAVQLQGDRLRIFYSRIGDCPESILMARMDLRGDWKTWKAVDPVTILQPELPYEGADAPKVPSRGGFAKDLVYQLRDPAIYEEDGRTYLLYSVAGENGIAIAELKD